MNICQYLALIVVIRSFWYWAWAKPSAILNLCFYVSIIFRQAVPLCIALPSRSTKKWLTNDLCVCTIFKHIFVICVIRGGHLWDDLTSPAINYNVRCAIAKIHFCVLLRVYIYIYIFCPLTLCESKFFLLENCQYKSTSSAVICLSLG